MKRNHRLIALALASVAGAMIIASCTRQAPEVSSSSISSTSLTPEVQAQYKVNWVTCGGSAVASSRQKVGTRVAAASSTRAGYNLLGWSSSYQASAKMGQMSDMVTFPFTMPDHNVTFYAVWAKEGGGGAYMENIKKSSVANHLYYHYFRYKEDYNDWDVWAWSYKPTAGEGARFDWIGRTTSSDGLSATGEAETDEAGAYIDIDLNRVYNGGWSSKTKTMGGTDVSFEGATQVGLQIVRSETRTSSSGFWVNDGSNLFVKLEDFAVPLDGGGVAYHVFAVQDQVQNATPEPIVTSGMSSPFDDDDGTNVTYGNAAYSNVNFSANPGKVKTADDFEDIGVGYQIMVSSFADSDGDGSGDIYGIEQKLDYLEALGVKALWLTPIQLSDSYHGYDITDYEKVDPKFGSAESPAAKEAGEVTSETAMADYMSLIEKAHARGMKIVMDLVLNHTSTSNKWFVSSANLDEDYRGYYQWGNHETDPSHINTDNYWYPYGDHCYSYYAKFGSAMPELNYSFQATRDAVENMSVNWVNRGVDGFRLDAVKHIYMLDEATTASGDSVIYDISASGNYSSNLSKNLHFFKELKKVVTERSGRDVFFVGENFDGHAYHVAPYYEAFDSMFDFYSYFNLTSAAATGRKNSTSGFGTAQGFMQGSGSYSTNADTDSKTGCRDSGGILSKANGSAWNFPAVYNTYNTYRGDTSLPGCFTSNHDIARVINRIAGTGGFSGIEAQGNVSTSTYASLEQSANAVKIAELMFPGCTWIYYGDEIGMTGNFPSGKTAQSDYADLWYRQPMKWVANGEKGDQYGTTAYYVTGSSQEVIQDEVNASSVVKGGLDQMNDANSDFSMLKRFVALKNGNDSIGKALRLGTMTASNFANGELAANVLCFTRSYNGTSVKVAVNFNGTTIAANSLGGTVLASYNGATSSSLPAYSAIVVRG